MRLGVLSLLPVKIECTGDNLPALGSPHEVGAIRIQHSGVRKSARLQEAGSDARGRVGRQAAQVRECSDVEICLRTRPNKYFRFATKPMMARAKLASWPKSKPAKFS
jgi:hypothetical protein